MSARRAALVGFCVGASVATGLLLAALLFATDVDTPIALEPKCETLIIHR